MIYNLDIVNSAIKEEGINLMVVSYGGCVSNTLIDSLEKNNYIIKTKTYNKLLCHCPHFIETQIPIIYVYDNPIKSFLSMKKRGKGFWDVNQQKMNNNINVELSDENLLKSMITQFNSWTSVKKDNILIIKSSELFENNIVNKLENFLKKKLYHFPIPYKTPKTNIEDRNKYNELFEKYKIEIDYINNFSAN